MKPKTMILMGLAVTCGLGASYMTSRLLAERTPVEDEKIEILVAKRNMSVGERLLKPEELFEKKQVSKESEPPDAIRDFEALKGKSMKQSRNKGEHVTPNNLRGEKEQLDIPEGYFAMGLGVNLEGTASGFATLPKSRVNIIWTVRGPDANSSYSQLLLQNVLVLAADLKLNSDGELASPAQVVTFALSTEDVLKINLAKHIGTLSLALRNVDERSTPEILKVTGKNLNIDKKREPEVVEVKPIIIAPPPPPVVEQEAPKFIKGHYDIVNGTDFGPREVTRVHYSQSIEDGTITIERTELLESTRVREQQPGAGSPKKGGGPRDF
jgi:pilus assembly protein CpaB